MPPTAQLADARAFPAARPAGASAYGPIGRLRLVVFYVAVLAINFTLTRPSPVDGLFALVLLLSFTPNQVITRQALFLFTILFAWMLSFFMSSINLIDNEGVAFQLMAIPFVMLLCVAACLVSSTWDQVDFERFLKVYVASTCIAATLGIIGFVTELELLTWDLRAKGLLDDPNMYGAFLLPGALSAIYLIGQGYRRRLMSAALMLIVFGLMLSFSRVAISALIVWGGLYLVIKNRRNLVRAGLYVVLVGIVVAILAIVADLTLDNFAEKLSDRFTVAKDYDLGYGGRYSRYGLAIPFILANPLGMGLFEIDRYFAEPIHNIWISSFLNYGWLAGIAWTLLMVLTCQITWFNLRKTRNELCLLIFLCWVSIMTCALLHQAERWRHLWLFTGVVWGLNAGALISGRQPGPASTAA